MIRLEGHAQGTTWHITYYADDTLVRLNEVDSILSVIDNSLSIYNPKSLISAFNSSERGIKTDLHFQAVIKKSLETWKATAGLSDITVAPLVEAWGFGVKSGNNTPPDSSINKILGCVGTRLIMLTADSLIKLKPCVKIDVNGIAQGYTVDVIANFFESHGISDYIVEVGGELRVKGKKQPDKKPFHVGIESPSVDDFSMPPMQTIIAPGSGAITTSGNYRKFHESKGRKVSHIIDPRNGQPVNNELVSVTVFAQDAITADAYDNALMLMGLDSAMKFVERRNDLAAFFIYKKPGGAIADTASSRFRQLIITP